VWCSHYLLGSADEGVGQDEELSFGIGTIEVYIVLTDTTPVIKEKTL